MTKRALKKKIENINVCKSAVSGRNDVHLVITGKHEQKEKERGGRERKRERGRKKKDASCLCHSPVEELEVEAVAFTKQKRPSGEASDLQKAANGIESTFGGEKGLLARLV